MYHIHRIYIDIDYAYLCTEDMGLINKPPFSEQDGDMNKNIWIWKLGVKFLIQKAKHNCTVIIITTTLHTQIYRYNIYYIQMYCINSQCPDVLVMRQWKWWSHKQDLWTPVCPQTHCTMAVVRPPLPCVVHSTPATLISPANDSIKQQWHIYICIIYICIYIHTHAHMGIKFTQFTVILK